MVEETNTKRIWAGHAAQAPGLVDRIILSRSGGARRSSSRIRSPPGRRWACPQEAIPARLPTRCQRTHPARPAALLPPALGDDDGDPVFIQVLSAPGEVLVWNSVAEKAEDDSWVEASL
jgi:hypothetical protein